MSGASGLEAYFHRIGFGDRARPDLETLRALHLLHPCAIPFENLSTLLGEPVRLKPQALWDKLIAQRRGGYCFEQNALFQSVLESIGFELLPLAARVVWNQEAGIANPRTHMALLVDIDDERFLCDVGFGGVTLTAPLALRSGIVQETPHERFRLVAAGQLFVLEVEQGRKWRPAYEFDLQPQQPIDYEAMNHFVQSHPNSHFRHVLMAGRPDAGKRFTLRGNEFRRYERGALTDQRLIDSPGTLEAVLREDFRIALPEAANLRPLLARIALAASE